MGLDVEMETLVKADLVPISLQDWKPTNKGKKWTRIRLAMSQNVIAVAELSDGSVLTNRKWIEVTLNGCKEDWTERTNKNGGAKNASEIPQRGKEGIINRDHDTNLTPHGHWVEEGSETQGNSPQDRQ